MVLVHAQPNMAAEEHSHHSKQCCIHHRSCVTCCTQTHSQAQVVVAGTVCRFDEEHLHKAIKQVCEWHVNLNTPYLWMPMNTNAHAYTNTSIQDIPQMLAPSNSQLCTHRLHLHLAQRYPLRYSICTVAPLLDIETGLLQIDSPTVRLVLSKKEHYKNNTRFRSVCSIGSLELSRCASSFVRWCAFSWCISSMLRSEPNWSTFSMSWLRSWNFGAFRIVSACVSLNMRWVRVLSSVRNFPQCCKCSLVHVRRLYSAEAYAAYAATNCHVRTSSGEAMPYRRKGMCARTTAVSLALKRFFNSRYDNLRRWSLQL